MPPQADRLSSLSDADRERVERLLFQFDSSWSAALLPKAVRSIPDDQSAIRDAILEELVKIDIDRRWTSGNGRPLEEYLTEFPDLGTAKTVSAVLIQTEYEVRKRCGNAISAGELNKRFPAQFDEWKRLTKDASAAPSSGRSILASVKTSQNASLEESVSETPPKTPASIPAQFGRYRVVKSLGRGAMGAVFLARDSQLDRDVAIKTPSFQQGATPELIERFLREARSAATLRHPNICPVYDVGEIDGRHFISMAYIQGRPLSDYIDGENLQPEHKVARVIRKLALALDNAHTNGVVHRDLKPANIMIDQHREPILMDFGLACRTEQANDLRVTQTGVMLGTPAYMSPEQADADRDRIGPASDIYSLGVIFYEFLTGELPFIGSLAAILGQIMTQDPPRPSEHRPDLDPDLEAICLKMMARKIEQRYASMKEVADALTGYLRQRSGILQTGRSAEQSASAKSKSDDEGLRELFDAPPASRRTRAEPSGGIRRSILPSFESLQPKWASHVNRFPPRTRWLLALGLTASVLLLGIVLMLRTPRGGTLRIEADDPNLEVLVDGETITLKDKQWEGRQQADQHTLAVKVGNQQLTIGTPTVVKLSDGSTVTHNLSLQLNGVTLSSNTFEIVRGKTAVVKITYQKQTTSQPPVKATQKPPVKVTKTPASGGSPPPGTEPGHAAPPPTGSPKSSGNSPWTITAAGRLEGHTDAIGHMVISPDGQRLVSFPLSSLQNDSNRLWDLTTDRPLPIPILGNNGLFISNRQLLLSGRTFQRFDLIRKRTTWSKRLPSFCQFPAVTPDRTKALVAGKIGGSVLYIVNLRTGVLLRKIDLGGMVVSIAVHPRGEMAWLGSQNEILILDLQTWKVTERLKGYSGPNWDAHFSGDGSKFAAAGSWGQPLWIWDVATRKVIRKFQGHRDSLTTAVSFLPGGHQIIRGSNDPSLRLWDIASGKQLAVVSTGTRCFSTLVVTPDGKHLYSAGGWNVGDTIKKKNIRENDYVIHKWRIGKPGDQSEPPSGGSSPPTGSTRAGSVSDREAAEWVLSIGGNVTTHAGTTTHSAAALPRTPFRIKEISLVQAKVTNTDLKRLRGLADLQSLDLGRTQISDAGLAELKGLTKLQYLVLDGTKITDAGLIQLKGMTKLQFLGLHHTRIGDAGLMHVKGLTNLTGLDLSQTQITDTGLTKLNSLTKLTDLSLAYTQITNAGLMKFKLEHLRNLYLNGTKISDAVVKNLKKVFPKCKISR